MVEVMGIYQNGCIKLDREYLSEKPVKVIVTFLEDVEVPSEKGLSFDDFSFSKSRKALENYIGSFADTLIEERRKDI